MEKKDKPVERERFYTWITNVYKTLGTLTARECAEVLWQDGKIPYPTRQSTQPRIVELCKMGRMEERGTKYDITTRKHVTVYQLI